MCLAGRDRSIEKWRVLASLPSARGAGNMATYLWIFLGGGLGSMARWAATAWLGRHLGESFPWGTVLVNVTGSLAIGFAAWWTGPDGRWVAPPGFREFFLAGVCGGYTTFSSFSLQTLNLLVAGEWPKAAANIVFSVLLCLGAVWLGHAAAVGWAGSREA
jgi:fluoride exporter